MSDLQKVLTRLGFVEISNWPELAMPWGVGIRLDARPDIPVIAWGRITWFRAMTLDTALTHAVFAMERYGFTSPSEKERSCRFPA